MTMVILLIKELLISFETCLDNFMSYVGVVSKLQNQNQLNQKIWIVIILLLQPLLRLIPTILNGLKSR